MVNIGLYETGPLFRFTWPLFKFLRSVESGPGPLSLGSKSPKVWLFFIYCQPRSRSHLSIYFEPQSRSYLCTSGPKIRITKMRIILTASVIISIMMIAIVLLLFCCCSLVFFLLLLLSYRRRWSRAAAAASSTGGP